MTARIEWRRPKPNIDADIKPFWDACAEHRLVVMQCKTCGARYWPATYCRNHKNEPFFGSLEWVTVSGRGTVAEHNVHHVAFDPTFQDQIPYAYGMVRTEEGPMLSGNIIDVDPDSVYIGMPVEVVFIDVVTPQGEEFTIPQWRPLERAEAAENA